MSQHQERKVLTVAGVEPAAVEKTGNISSTGTIVRGVAEGDEVAMVVTFTLTGTNGTANVPVNGTNYLATFDTTLEETADDFVDTHAADILADEDIVVTANAPDELIFTANTPGVPMVIGAGVNVAGDLDGTAATTTANEARTYFEDEVNEGDYIYNNAQGVAAGHEVRRVIAVYATPNSTSSQRFDIASAFTVDLPDASTLHIAKRRWRKVTIVNIGAGNAEINNVAFEAGEAAKIVLGSDDPASSVEPFTYDGSGGNDIQATLEE